MRILTTHMEILLCECTRRVLSGNDDVLLNDDQMVWQVFCFNFYPQLVHDCNWELIIIINNSLHPLAALTESHSTWKETDEAVNSVKEQSTEWGEDPDLEYRRDKVSEPNHIIRFHLESATSYATIEWAGLWTWTSIIINYANGWFARVWSGLVSLDGGWDECSEGIVDSWIDRFH